MAFPASRTVISGAPQFLRIAVPSFLQTFFRSHFCFGMFRSPASTSKVWECFLGRLVFIPPLLGRGRGLRLLRLPSLGSDPGVAGLRRLLPMSWRKVPGWLLGETALTSKLPLFWVVKVLAETMNQAGLTWFYIHGMRMIRVP